MYQLNLLQLTKNLKFMHATINKRYYNDDVVNIQSTERISSSTSYDYNHCFLMSLTWDPFQTSSIDCQNFFAAQEVYIDPITNELDFFHTFASQTLANAAERMIKPLMTHTRKSLNRQWTLNITH